MKYVIFKHRSGMLMPVIIPDHVTHSSVNIKDARLNSAGFFNASYLKQVTILPMGIESLKLEPNAGRDAKLLENVLLNSGTSAFIPFPL